MTRKHIKTLTAIFARPVSGNVQWREIEALFKALGVSIQEREGSRVAVVLFGAGTSLSPPTPITEY